MTDQTTANGSVIFAGYEWGQRIVSEAPIFPENGLFLAHVRRKISDPVPIAVLESNAGLFRISDTEMELRIPAAATDGMQGGSVVLDMVRTDLPPDKHLQFILEIPVAVPVTRRADL